MFNFPCDTLLPIYDTDECIVSMAIGKYCSLVNIIISIISHCMFYIFFWNINKYNMYKRKRLFLTNIYQFPERTNRVYVDNFKVFKDLITSFTTKYFLGGESLNTPNKNKLIIYQYINLIVDILYQTLSANEKVQELVNRYAHGQPLDSLIRIIFKGGMMMRLRTAQLVESINNNTLAIGLNDMLLSTFEKSDIDMSISINFERIDAKLKQDNNVNTDESDIIKKSIVFMITDVIQDALEEINNSFEDNENFVFLFDTLNTQTKSKKLIQLLTNMNTELENIKDTLPLKFRDPNEQSQWSIYGLNLQGVIQMSTTSHQHIEKAYMVLNSTLSSLFSNMDNCKSKHRSKRSFKGQLNGRRTAIDQLCQRLNSIIQSFFNHTNSRGVDISSLVLNAIEIVDAIRTHLIYVKICNSIPQLVYQYHKAVKSVRVIRELFGKLHENIVPILIQYKRKNFFVFPKYDMFESIVKTPIDKNEELVLEMKPTDYSMGQHTIQDNQGICAENDHSNMMETGIYVSSNTNLYFNNKHFNLVRIKLNAQVVFVRHSNSNDFVRIDEVFGKKLSGELLDVSIQFHDSNDVVAAEFDEAYEKMPIPLAENQTKYGSACQLYAYKWSYMYKDLERMLFFESTKPWDDSKYEKRLRRVIAILFLITMQTNELHCEDMQLSSDSQFLTECSHSKTEEEIIQFHKLISNSVCGAKRFILARHKWLSFLRCIEERLGKTSYDVNKMRSHLLNKEYKVDDTAHVKEIEKFEACLDLTLNKIVNDLPSFEKYWHPYHQMITQCHVEIRKYADFCNDVLKNGNTLLDLNINIPWRYEGSTFNWL